VVSALLGLAPLELGWTLRVGRWLGAGRGLARYSPRQPAKAFDKGGGVSLDERGFSSAGRTSYSPFDLSTKLCLPDETNVCLSDRRRRMKRVVTAFALQIGDCALRSR